MIFLGFLYFYDFEELEFVDLLVEGGVLELRAAF